MKTHSLKYRILRGMLSVLGFGSMAACTPPDMYGPDPSNILCMYGPSPYVEYVPDNTSVSDSACPADMPETDVPSEEDCDTE